MKINSRTQARRYIIQVLYTWELSKNNILNIQKQYLKYMNINTVDITYFNEIIIGIMNNYIMIDKKILLYLNQESQDVGQIEKAILRLCFYELYKRLDIPYKVSINEGIELAKLFGSNNSHKFINGILDKVYHKDKQYIY